MKNVYFSWQGEIKRDTDEEDTLWRETRSDYRAWFHLCFVHNKASDLKSDEDKKKKKKRVQYVICTS